MATGLSTSKRRSSRNRRRVVGKRRGGIKAGVAHTDPKSRSTGIGRPIRLAIPLRAFLKAERRALIQTQSLLVCILQAMEADDGDEGGEGPYYPDVVGLAAETLRRRVVNLDDLLLAGKLPRE